MRLKSVEKIAGGEVSISRPINQGFALVKNRRALKKHSLYLNRNGEDFEAETGLMSSAVLPNYQAYRYYPIRVDSRNIPMGIKAPPQEVVVAPPFRGGVLVSLDAEYSKALAGKIKWQGKGLALKMGSLQSVNDKESYSFFTNRKGRFLVEAVRPGEYQVIIGDKNLGNVTITEEGEGIQYWEYEK